MPGLRLRHQRATGNRDRLHRAVWIDDQPKSVVKHAQHLQRRGWHVRVLRPDDEQVATEAKNADVVLLDLRWSSLRRKAARRRFANAKRLAQYLVSESPTTPILFVSNYFVTDEFGAIEREVSPTAITDRVDKHHEDPRPKDADQVSPIIGEIGAKLTQLLSKTENMLEIRDQQPIEFTDSSNELEDIFGVTPRQYDALDLDARLNLSKAAARLAIHLVDREFEGSPAEWIVLSGVPPKVILWGARGEEPDDQTLDTLANKYGTIPFVFSRPEQIS